MTKSEIFENENSVVFNSLEKEIIKLKKENAIMKILCTTKGFFKMFFEQLKYFKSELLAFEYVNKLYLYLFGVQRYTDFKSFKNA